MIDSNRIFSPWDSRYAKDLPVSLSEGSLLRAQVEVEKVWLLCLMEEGLCPTVPKAKLDEALQDLSFEEIEIIEHRTQHATRALVEAMNERLRAAGLEELTGWVHVGLTSFDTVDTATRYRLKSFFENDFLGLLEELKRELVKLSNTYADYEQAGRTHGQWAVPTLFGLSFAEAFERIKFLDNRMRNDLSELRGQASGAVGGYHATSLLVQDPLGLEEKFLKKLGLKAHMASTQIIPPEDLVALAQSASLIGAVIAKVANDLRHLARSEIGEISEGMAEGQVGSSTMPQKRNPWNLEHVCSLYKILQSRLSLMEHDLISEHQRDLTNSASSRFAAEVFGTLFLMTKRLLRVLRRLEVHGVTMKKTLERAGSSVYGEAFYILAAKQGVADAHDAVRQSARESEQSGETLFEVVKKKNLLPKEMNFELLKKEVLRGSRMKLKRILENQGG